MKLHSIVKGKDLKIKGKPQKDIIDVSLPNQLAILPPNFRGFKPRLAVKVDDQVKVGSPVLTDKARPEIQIVSPASGKVVAINRGEKRALLEVVIETDGNQTAETGKSYSSEKLESIGKEEVISRLMEGGLWPALRQRPFSKIADPSATPKSIFVRAINTDPLAIDIDAILEGKEADFQAGLDVLSNLTEGNVYLCTARNAKSKALTESKNAEIHKFSGPHPAGNVSTHIHAIDPINKGDIVWYVEAWDVVNIGRLFLSGQYSTEKYVAVTGECAENKYYAKTHQGAPLSTLLKGSDLQGARCISGSVLTGTDVGKDGYVGFYDTQITAIPEGGKRELLGWMTPGANKYTFSRTFLAAFSGGDEEFSLDTDKNGSDRAIVLNHLYDDLVPLDIMVYFLLKSILSGNIDESEQLGILECDEEDFALCSFACPSKTNVGEIIRHGLDVIEKEG